MAGSTWDPVLINARGLAMGRLEYLCGAIKLIRNSLTSLFHAGQEAKGLGVNVLLGPVAGPLGKIPTVR